MSFIPLFLWFPTFSHAALPRTAAAEELAPDHGRNSVDSNGVRCSEISQALGDGQWAMVSGSNRWTLGMGPPVDTLWLCQNSY